ncbi:hypothetical protein N0V93_007088 [Gnomoniopsis smithogilvyi]|uniref:DUF3955 domain-containing protein n=1 Tax=Gnomoniopsis smithogilvyi TaxID=1191159 RepID=A0A9W9CWB4_9PEZI|nr:hypothetical protein N0V93_007088 [Gnomoniopsis smithogilvyi]
MAPLEPLAGTAELAPTSAPGPRQRSLSVSSHTAQTHLSASLTSLRSTAPSSAASSPASGIHALTARLGIGGVARRTLGIALLLVTVFLWTASNFLASYIFSDHTYDKPFFVVYINTSVFALSLVPMLVRFVAREGVVGIKRELRAFVRNDRSKASIAGERAGGLGRSLVGGRQSKKTPTDEEHHGLLAESGEEDGFDSLDEAEEQAERGSSSGGTFELDDTPDPDGAPLPPAKLSLRETAVLSLEFCGLWFCANYFASACLEYTSVGSVTILTSTSSVWTLLVGVLASLAGVVLISTVDLSGASDEDRGTFPHKSTASIAVGDGMAFFSAIVYGLYVTVMKRRVGDEERVDMPLFFGLVGLFNLVLLWPGFLLLHWTQIEPFSWPPTGKVWAIIVLNSISSFISDMSWAYAMLLTTPLVVTVGLSLTIPLSLIGEMIQYAQYSSWIYWVGAGIVLLSFLFINHESSEGDTEKEGS